MDYNIYLHTDGAANSNPTKPWASDGGDSSPSFQTNTQPWENVLKKGISVAQNPDGLVSSATSKISKAIPQIAIAAALIKLTDKVISEVIDFKTITTGDYTNQIMYGNIKAGISAAFRPISTTINIAKQKRINRNVDEASALRMKLQGDDFLNGFNGYGV